MPDSAVTVFVIMPFHEDFDRVYEDLIKSPLEAAGYRVSRADDPGEDSLVHQNIHDRIVAGIWDADYVIADLTTYRHNVLYELGIAHTLNKRTILVSQHLPDDLPFDIQTHYVINYSVDSEARMELSNKILRQITLSEKGNFMFSNIVHRFAQLNGREIVTQPPARKP